MDDNTPWPSFRVYVEETDTTFTGSQRAPAYCQLPGPGSYHLHVRGGLELEPVELQVVASSMHDTLRMTVCLQWMSEAAQPYPVAWPDTILAYHDYLRACTDAGTGVRIRLDSARWKGSDGVTCSVSIINPTDVPVHFINPWKYGCWEVVLGSAGDELLGGEINSAWQLDPTRTYHLDLHSFEIPPRDSLTGIQLGFRMEVPRTFQTDNVQLAVRHVWPRQDTLWLWRESIDRSHPGYLQMANRNLYFIWYIYQGTLQSNALPHDSFPIMNHNGE